MSDRLNSAISGVTPASPPEDSDRNLDLGTEPNSASDGSKNVSGEDGAEGSAGRTVDNVYGELTRKLSRQEENFQSAINGIGAKVDQLVTQISQSPQPKPAESGNQLDAMSITELRR